MDVTTRRIERSMLLRIIPRTAVIESDHVPHAHRCNIHGRQYLADIVRSHVLSHAVTEIAAKAPRHPHLTFCCPRSKRMRRRRAIQRLATSHVLETHVSGKASNMSVRQHLITSSLWAPSASYARMTPCLTCTISEMIACHGQLQTQTEKCHGK